MSWAESVRIETPEQIDFELESAGPGSRFVAQVIDWLLKGLVVGVLVVVGIILAPIISGRDIDDLSRSTRSILIGVLIVVGFGFFFGYDVYYEGFLNGQTPGKRYCGIRVVRDSGGPIDATAACIRNLVGLADLLPVIYILGGIVMLLNSRAQRLGDLAAGTVVIRERNDEAPDEAEEFIDEMASEEFVFSPEELDSCEAGDLHVLFSFFSRLSIMEPRERRRLAERLCEIFLEKTGYRPKGSMESRRQVLGFLASLYRDLKTRREHR